MRSQRGEVWQGSGAGVIPAPPIRSLPPDPGGRCVAIGVVFWGMQPVQVPSRAPPNMKREHFMVVSFAARNTEKVIFGLCLQTCEMFFLWSLQPRIVRMGNKRPRAVR